MRLFIFLFLFCTYFLVDTNAQTTYDGCNYLQPLSPLDDAFHYDGGILWMEWWTFYAYDPVNNVSAMINNIFAKAVDVVGASLVYVTVLSPQTGAISITNWHTLDSFSASDSSPSNTVAGSTMEMTDDYGNSFHVYGKMENGEIQWDLNFDRGKPALCLSNRSEIGYDQLFSWISYMPGSIVGGQITINGTQFQVKGYGEHDHVWGQFDESLLQWTWAESFGGELLIYLFHGGGGFYNLNSGSLYISLPNNSSPFIFHKNDYSIVQKFDGLPYPKSTTITVDSVQGVSLVLQFYITSISMSSSGSASENDAFFLLHFCQNGVCNDYSQFGWTEFSGPSHGFP